jgi:hypothetical protein
MESILEKGGCGGPAEKSWIPADAIATAEDTHLIRTLESKALALAKEEITLYYEQGQWDDYKKITNPYEYIFLSWNRRTSRSVATRSPLSRSYFKMIEFWKYAKLTKELQPLVAREGGLRSAHSAEGPGGFLEAIAVMTKKLKWKYHSCHAMTLRSTTKHVPGWRKAVTFLETHPMVHISYGADDTGDILVKANRNHFLDECKKVHLYTADGGFDFSGDYSGQEDSIFSLLVAECLIGVQALMKGGVMIIKCFDTTDKQTLDLLWMVCSLFREWRFMKPRTSRAGNAERYFIGIGFLGEEAGVNEFVKLVEAACPYKKGVPLLKNKYPKEWIQTMWEVQEAIEREEYRIIRDTIALIREEHSDVVHLRSLVRQNVLRSMEWCKEHDETISTEWTSHLDRYVAQEVIDLFQILKPIPPPIVPSRIPSWTVRSERVPADRMFEGFRRPVSAVLTHEEEIVPVSISSFFPEATALTSEAVESHTAGSSLTSPSASRMGNPRAEGSSLTSPSASRMGNPPAEGSSLTSPSASRMGNPPAEGSSLGRSSGFAAISSPPAEASQTDPPERFPHAPRRYADLFSRPRRTLTVEASSPVHLSGKF